NNSYTGLVIQIHGYNTGIEKITRGGKQTEGRDYVREGWQKTWEYLNQQDLAISNKPNSFVYLGYRWPSESVPSNFNKAGKALPIILTLLFRGGLILAAIGLLLLLIFPTSIVDFFAAILIILGVATSMLVGTLFILRIIVYFRDSYRATNFGVPDLVEFIRQLDLGLVKRYINDSLFETVTQAVSERSELPPGVLSKAVRKTWEAIENKPDYLSHYQEDAFRLLLSELKQGDLSAVDDAVFLNIYDGLVRAKKPAYTATEFQDAAKYWNGEKKRIRLTFIGHSMGGFVTAQVIRILSDVFDPAAIGDSQSLEKLPPSHIGRAFLLGRLILISPDIPLITIISRRTNFLRSALRRFEEAYLFSSEGDLALRLASTTANYFSFPTGTRSQGFRLGNVSVNLPQQNVYGIVNFQKLISGKVDHLLDYIGVQTLERDTRSVRQDASRKQNGKVDEESLAATKQDPESIADLFTYLDCTEYRDLTTYENRPQKETNVLICEGQRSPLTFFNYAKLLKAYVDFSSNPGKGVGVDVHGGYFYGNLSNLLIYRLAFLGFQGLLDSLVFQPLPEWHSSSAAQADWQTKLKRAEVLPQAERRRVALDYFSWLCEQRKIQVAASPERYYVDVLGYNRAKVRAGILTREQHSDS
ncbi:MAG TPA: alpha/beta hydrolase, partial [Thermosynechococcaceae cyanobacterium]